MRGKIFRSIWLALSSVLTLSFILITALLYSHYTNEQLDQLRSETRLVAQSLALDGTHYFDTLGAADFRITWITSDGTIIYDNEFTFVYSRSLQQRFNTVAQKSLDIVSGNDDR